MKLSGRHLASFFEAPPKGVMGVLIYGNDPMRVASKREKLIHAILGPNADKEMRLARISRENLKKSGLSKRRFVIEQLKGFGPFWGLGPVPKASRHPDIEFPA